MHLPSGGLVAQFLVYSYFLLYPVLLSCKQYVFKLSLPNTMTYTSPLLPSSPHAPHSTIHKPSSIHTILKVNCVALWLRLWTQDPGVWSSIPAALVMCQSFGWAFNPHHLWPLSSNGYQVERKLILCEWLQLQNIVLHFPQGDETVKERVPTT